MPTTIVVHLLRETIYKTLDPFIETQSASLEPSYVRFAIKTNVRREKIHLLFKLREAFTYLLRCRIEDKTVSPHEPEAGFIMDDQQLVINCRELINHFKEVVEKYAVEKNGATGSTSTMLVHWVNQIEFIFNRLKDATLLDASSEPNENLVTTLLKSALLHYITRKYCPRFCKGITESIKDSVSSYLRNETLTSEKETLALRTLADLNGKKTNYETIHSYINTIVGDEKNSRDRHGKKQPGELTDALTYMQAISRNAKEKAKSINKRVLTNESLFMHFFRVLAHGALSQGQHVSAEFRASLDIDIHALLRKTPFHSGLKQDEKAKTQDEKRFAELQELFSCVNTKEKEARKMLDSIKDKLKKLFNLIKMNNLLDITYQAMPIPIHLQLVNSLLAYLSSKYIEEINSNKTITNIQEAASAFFRRMTRNGKLTHAKKTAVKVQLSDLIKLDVNATTYHLTLRGIIATLHKRDEQERMDNSSGILTFVSSSLSQVVTVNIPPGYLTVCVRFYETYCISCSQAESKVDYTPPIVTYKKIEKKILYLTNFAHNAPKEVKNDVTMNRLGADLASADGKGEQSSHVRSLISPMSQNKIVSPDSEQKGTHTQVETQTDTQQTNVSATKSKKKNQSRKMH